MPINIPGLPASEVGGAVRALYFAKSAIAQIFMNDVAEITQVNVDGSYNINIRARNEDVLGVVSTLPFPLKVGDFVNLVSIQGDYQRIEIIGLAPRYTSGIEGVVVQEYIYNLE